MNGEKAYVHELEQVNPKIFIDSWKLMTELNIHEACWVDMSGTLPWLCKENKWVFVIEYISKDTICSKARELKLDYLAVYVCSLKDINEDFARYFDFDYRTTISHLIMNNQYVLLNEASAKIFNLLRAIECLIMSADCTWETRNEGHDWPEAMENAREVLKQAKNYFK